MPRGRLPHSCPPSQTTPSCAVTLSPPLQGSPSGLCPSLERGPEARLQRFPTEVGRAGNRTRATASGANHGFWPKGEVRARGTGPVEGSGLASQSSGKGKKEWGRGEELARSSLNPCSCEDGAPHQFRGRMTTLRLYPPGILVLNASDNHATWELHCLQ